MPGKHRFLFVVAFFFCFQYQPKRTKESGGKTLPFFALYSVSHLERNPEGATKRDSPELSHGIVRGRAKLQKAYSGERFGEIALDRHGVFSYYLKMIGKRGK